MEKREMDFSLAETEREISRLKPRFRVYSFRRTQRYQRKMHEGGERGRTQRGFAGPLDRPNADGQRGLDKRLAYHDRADLQLVN